MLDQGDWSQCLALFTSHSDIEGSEEGERERERKREGERGRRERGEGKSGRKREKRRVREGGGREEGETRRNAVQRHITPIKIAVACNENVSAS